MSFHASDRIEVDASAYFSDFFGLFSYTDGSIFRPFIKTSVQKEVHSKSKSLLNPSFMSLILSGAEISASPIPASESFSEYSVIVCPPLENARVSNRLQGVLPNSYLQTCLNSNFLSTDCGIQNYLLSQATHDDGHQIGKRI